MRRFYYRFKAYLDKRKQESDFRKSLDANNRGALRIVVGSSGIYQEGWIPTEIHFLNLLQEKDWAKYFEQSTIQNILAEHVWEHLTLGEGKIAIQHCFKYLKKRR